MDGTLYELADQASLTAITARNVRSWMARERWSARKLAPMIGMSNVALNRRLRGEVEFSVTELFQLAEVLRCDALQLLPKRVAPRSEMLNEVRFESRLGESNSRPIHYESHGSPPSHAHGAIATLDGGRVRREASIAVERAEARA